MISFEITGYLITFLSFHGTVLLSESTPSPIEELPKPAAINQKRQSDDMDIFPLLSVREPEVTSLQKTIEDGLKQMKKQMEFEFNRELGEFPIRTGFLKKPSGIPGVHTHEKAESPEHKSESHEAEATKGELEDMIPEDSDPTIRLLKSLNTALEGKQYLDKKTDNSSQIPLDIGRILHHFDDLMKTTDLLGDTRSDEAVFITNLDDTDSNADDAGDLTFIKIEDGEGPFGIIPFQKIDIAIPLGDDGAPTTLDDDSSKMKGLVDGFISTMRNMMNMLQNTGSVFEDSEGAVGNKSRNNEHKVDIKIEDHGTTYNIPPNAYIDRKNPEMVNITWPSERNDVNNSLCMKVSKDEAGHISFQHVRLNIVTDNGIHEYKLEEPVVMKNADGTNTMIVLGEGVGVNFPSSESLDVVFVEKREKLSTHWLAFSVALLGLLVGGLIMILSYLMHSRNKSYTRKDSISKEPIA